METLHCSFSCQIQTQHRESVKYTAISIVDANLKDFGHDYFFLFLLICYFKELLEAIVNELLDEVSLGLCFEIHRACKLGTFLLDEMDTE